MSEIYDENDKTISHITRFCVERLMPVTISSVYEVIFCVLPRSTNWRVLVSPLYVHHATQCAQKKIHVFKMFLHFTCARYWLASILFLPRKFVARTGTFQLIVPTDKMRTSGRLFRTFGTTEGTCSLPYFVLRLHVHARGRRDAKALFKLGSSR